MINNIQIKNFRLFDKLEIKDLKRINLFVGRNNSGKSTILESIFLNIGATNAKLPIIINAFRNLDRLDDITFRSFFHDFNIEEPIEIKITRQNPKEFRNLYISPLFSQKKEKTIQLNYLKRHPIAFSKQAIYLFKLYSKKYGPIKMGGKLFKEAMKHSKFMFRKKDLS